MKPSQAIKTPALISGILLASLTLSQAKITFYIKQVQEGAGGEDGLSTDVYIEDEELLKENKSSTGVHTALMEIGEFGSTFYFYVQGIDPDGPPILLDQKFVGQYVATADVEITSDDPYVPVRTRSDQPFKVKITSSNQQWTSAQSTGTAPELNWNPLSIVIDSTYEKQEKDGSPISSGIVDMTDGSTPGKTTLALTAGEGSEYTTKTHIPADTDSAEATVPYASVSSLMGKESIVVQAQSDTDANGDPIYRQVGSGTIQIWPMAQGKITGLTEGQRITQAMPDAKISLQDLYPNSTTYAEIIEGPPSLDGGIVPVYTSFKLGPYNGDEPLDGEIPVTNWDSYIKKNGQYTLQVVTKTPFNNGNPERIMAVTFHVDRTVSVNGAIISSE